MKQLVNTLMRTAFETVCRVDKRELDKVPAEGPLIVYSNHTGELEVPLLYAELQPRPVTGWAKSELWERWLPRKLLNLWDAIPLRRGQADVPAMRAALGALKRNKIVAIAPEGTLNRTGVLQRAHAGVAALAVRSGAPLMPIAHWGVEKLSDNLRHLKRTDVHIRVGRPFKLEVVGEPVNRVTRQQIADEMMFRLSALLPRKYRGEYTLSGQLPGRLIRCIDL